ncbi:hypothetical protein HPB50_026723 [Hyalomma asiaticum]|uniref:Uncharacterized protein n=1 Tax=Hyalomma asiaticum TaxID=266040 RepID=A0ACB7SKT3_HYAAI|nr:hypothetical protein HPB50_026723 [Hyalomma asiaticum]
MDYAQLLRDFMLRSLSNIPASLRRKLLEADLRPECTAGLLRTLRGFQNLEPWALRLFDASGKYPTGLFEGAHVDMGAFDECIRTAVRDGFGNVLSQGQYCNLLVYVNNGTAIEEMFQSFSDVLHPRLHYFKSYFSYTKFPVGRLGVCSLSDCSQQDLQTLFAKGVLFELVTAFSAISNTRFLLKVADKTKPDQFALQFLHGMRFYSVVHIAMGHCGSVMSDTWTSIPLFFIIMCLYSLEPFVDGPNTKAFFENLHHEVSYHWWHWLLQIRNFYGITAKRLQQAAWYGSVACALFCVFVKFAWYTSLNPVSRGVTLLAAFFDRILWTIFLAWTTFACCTGRGGILTKLLSWNAYVPLSKLSFGVYLIHVPFLQLLYHASRERRFWSVFNQAGTLLGDAGSNGPMPPKPPSALGIIPGYPEMGTGLGALSR